MVTPRMLSRDSREEILKVFALFDDLVAPTLCPGRSGVACLNVSLELPWGTASAADAITGEPLPFKGNGTHTALSFTVPFRGGRWVRTTASGTMSRIACVAMAADSVKARVS